MTAELQQQRRKCVCKVCNKEVDILDYYPQIRTCSNCIMPFLKKVDKEYNL